MYDGYWIIGTLHALRNCGIGPSRVASSGGREALTTHISPRHRMRSHRLPALQLRVCLTVPRIGPIRRRPGRPRCKTMWEPERIRIAYCSVRPAPRISQTTAILSRGATALALAGRAPAPWFRPHCFPAPRHRSSGYAPNSADYPVNCTTAGWAVAPYFPIAEPSTSLAEMTNADRESNRDLEPDRWLVAGGIPE